MYWLVIKSMLGSFSVSNPVIQNLNARSQIDVVKYCPTNDHLEIYYYCSFDEDRLDDCMFFLGRR